MDYGLLLPIFVYDLAIARCKAQEDLDTDKGQVAQIIRTPPLGL
jgi:hypothetical protein